MVDAERAGAVEDGAALIARLIEPCARNAWTKAAGDSGASFSTLGTDADAAKVLKYPQLVLDGDWAQLYDLTGVFTDGKRLEEIEFVEDITLKTGPGGGGGEFEVDEMCVRCGCVP